MKWFSDPFFWALVSMFGMVGAEAVVGSTRLARSRLLGLLSVGLFGLGRVVLVLPGISQPRFHAGDWSWIVGGIIFAVGLVLTLPAFMIRAFTGPDAGVSLKSSGFYGLVRNPIYLGEVMWCLGLAVMFRSKIGIALVPVWWAALWLLTMIEEERLALKLGPPYQEYKRRIRGRIIPGLPI